jgi:hypothetical protein
MFNKCNCAVGFLFVSSYLARNSHRTLGDVMKLEEYPWTRDSSVGVVSGYGLDDRVVGVPVPVGPRIFSSPRPDRLWGPPVV